MLRVGLGKGFILQCFDNGQILFPGTAADFRIDFFEFFQFASGVEFILKFGSVNLTV
jgi:hypothetical protein